MKQKHSVKSRFLNVSGGREGGAREGPNISALRLLGYLKAQCHLLSDVILSA